MKSAQFTIWSGPSTKEGVELFPDEISFTLPPGAGLTNNQALLSAWRNSSPLRVYDDTWGPVFIHRDSMGMTGIVRAQTWGDAYSICEDEFFPEADETVEELQEAYGPGETEWSENILFQEAYGFRSNGPNSRDKIQHGIYSKDLNGDSLVILTPALQAKLEIFLTVSNQYGALPFQNWSDALGGPYTIS